MGACRRLQRQCCINPAFTQSGKTDCSRRVISILEKFKKNQFLFEELVKRDFKEKYKRTVLGMVWSLLSPLLSLLVMKIVFGQFFGRSIPFYTTYLFSGNLIMSYFREATKGGMNSLMSNAKIFTKINIPKYLFIFSRNVSSLVNFLIILVVYFFFCALDGITFGVHMLGLAYPILCIVAFNLGIGMLLSAFYVFFRDVQYLYDIFLTLLTYMSAIFYKVDGFSQQIQQLFHLNPVYCYIEYFRIVVIDGVVPSLALHILCAIYAAVAVFFGFLMYKKNNHKFLYYV